MNPKLLEAPEDQVDRTIETVRAVMEDAPGPSVALSVPLVVGRPASRRLVNAVTLEERRPKVFAAVSV